MRRASDIQIIVNLSLPDENLQYSATFLKLGGEGKVAVFNDKVRKVGTEIKKDTIDLKSNIFKLYLSTPAIFKNGWKPNLDRLGIKAELIAAVVGKPLHVGGFDMMLKKAKPMLKAVPAGSVFYFSTEEPTEKLLDKLQGESVSDFLNEQGFGIAYIGNY